MQKDEAISMANLLCWRAGVAPCRVDWSTRHTRGCYRPDQKAIKVGPRAWGSVEAQLIHEVAHHVTMERGAKARGVAIPKRPAARRAFYRKYPGLRQVTWSDGKRWARVFHGPTFVETLKELAALWYGDAKRYDWANEYRSIRNSCD